MKLIYLGIALLACRPAGSYAMVKVEDQGGVGARLLKVMVPSYPLGIYCVEEQDGALPEEALKECQEHLINCVQTSFKRTRAGQDLDILRRYGMRALCDPEWGGALPGTLRELANDPSVLAWYVVDEPADSGFCRILVADSDSDSGFWRILVGPRQIFCGQAVAKYVVSKTGSWPRLGT